MAAGTPLTKTGSKMAKEKDEIGQNIQVFVRCRPLNQAEKDKKAYSIVETPHIKQIDVKDKLSSKSYQFDRVFGPKSQQLDVYKSVVEPLIEQVMMGYNCTVFAYGQTGTGKTFTMEGGVKRSASVSWDEDPTSGIIPRALAQILDNLKAQSDNLEYSVKISFLELYNEEIFDLLSTPVDDTTKLRLYEDAYKKGSVIIQGLEEVQVHTKSQVYTILEKGSDKRKTAETLMNANSSRSHTVFTVTVHIKEAMLEEEVLRIGKLNLVDLAGSENVGRSGAKDGRAREAGNINQSLLTLGRVITNLVERAPHIPYRESKLTRLLQDSLGGRTKTSIIATVSPATINLEETLSTLDYAYRARSILNRPEINARLSKEDLVKEYSTEMDRIKRDLMQLREKNGIYIAQENYLEMLHQMEQNEVLISEKTKEMIALKEEMEKKKLLFDEVEKNMIYKSREIQKVKDQLEVKEENLAVVSKDLKKVVREKEEQEHLVSKHVETEHKLGLQAKKLLVGCDDMDTDLDKLHNKLDKVKTIDDDNEEAKKSFEIEFEEIVSKFNTKIEKFGEEHEQSCATLKKNLKIELDERSTQISELVAELKTLLQRNVEIESKSMKEIVENETKSTSLSSKASKLDQEVASKEKERGDDYIAQIVPNLHEISNKVIAQAKALELFSIKVNENFEKIKAKVRNDTKSVVDIVLETEKIVKSHFEFENSAVEKLNGLNEQVLKSHEKMKKSLKDLETAYNEHNATVESLSSNLDEVIVDISQKVAPLKKNVNENHEQLKVTIENVKKEVTQSVEENKEQTRKSVEECVEISEDIVKAKNELKTNSSTFITDSLANIEEVFHKVEESLDDRKKDLQEVKLEVKERTQLSKKDFKTAEINVASKLSIKQESNIDSNVDDLVTLTKTNKDDMKENVDVLRSKVTDLINEGITIYEPSGETPSRTDRQYPRYLAATSPHQRIIERFRRTVEADEAAKNPVEDSLDSAVSNSFHTNNTSEDVRERTGSFSSDLSLDNESVASSQLKKRELKKPEKRNILGKSNAINKA